jgi:hypothetical protein
MPPAASPETICAPSPDIVAREIEGEIIIVPLVAGVGDADDDLYTLNETGHVIWHLLDGNRSLGEIARLLGNQFDAPLEELEADVLGFADELLHRRILALRG